MSGFIYIYKIPSEVNCLIALMSLRKIKSVVKNILLQIFKNVILFLPEVGPSAPKFR